MEQERRSLRLTVRNLEWTREPDAVVLRFRLTRGSFATTVLRELFDATTPDGEPESES
jgi:tRNA(Glu) U13 pseudouridine synthase TruD